MGISYGFGVQMETSGRIDCGIFTTGRERSDDPGKTDWLPFRSGPTLLTS
jgi:hypothetical protein